MGWEVGGAEGGWGTSLSPYICSTRVLFYHLTYLVQGRTEEETTTEANTRSVVRNQLYEIFFYVPLLRLHLRLGVN